MALCVMFFLLPTKDVTISDWQLAQLKHFFYKDFIVIYNIWKER